MLAATNVDLQDKKRMTEALLSELENPTVPYDPNSRSSFVPAAVSDVLGTIDDDEKVIFLTYSGPDSVEQPSFMPQYEDYTHFALNFTPTKDLDVLQFWRKYEYRFPLLAMMAKLRLSIPASSAPSERAFSITKQVITHRRNLLSPTTASICMVIRANRDLIRKAGTVSPPGSAEARSFRVGM